MGIGAVLGEAWELYRRFLWQFFLTALAVFAVLDLLSALAARVAGDSVLAALFWSVGAGVIGVVGYFWVQPALVELARDVRDRRADRTVGATYRAVRPRLPPASRPKRRAGARSRAARGGRRSPRRSTRFASRPGRGES